MASIKASAKSFNQFALTKKRDVKAANTYLKNTFASIIQGINEKLKKDNDDEQR